MKILRAAREENIIENIFRLLFRILEFSSIDLERFVGNFSSRIQKYSFFFFTKNFREKGVRFLNKI